MKILGASLRRFRLLVEDNGLIRAVLVSGLMLLDRIRNCFICASVGVRHGYLGSRSKILGARHINFGARIFIQHDAWIEAITEYKGMKFNPIIKLGDDLGASPGLHISSIEKVVVGAGCLFGSNVMIIDHNHGSYYGEQLSPLNVPPASRALVSNGAITIGKNCWFGDNVCVMGGVTIGDGVVVGANSVVTTDLPDQIIAVGSPAKVIKRFSDEAQEWKSVI